MGKPKSVITSVLCGNIDTARRQAVDGERAPSVAINVEGWIGQVCIVCDEYADARSSALKPQLLV